MQLHSFKCQDLALNKAHVLLTTPNSLLLYIVGNRRSTGLLSAKSLKILSYFVFLAKACSAYRIARLCSMLPRNKPAKNFILISTIRNQTEGTLGLKTTSVTDDVIDWPLLNKILGDAKGKLRMVLSYLLA